MRVYFPSSVDTEEVLRVNVDQGGAVQGALSTEYDHRNMCKGTLNNVRDKDNANFLNYMKILRKIIRGQHKSTTISRQ